MFAKYCLLIAVVPALAADPPASEDLRYNVNWPTGLSLGEATLRVARNKTEAGPQLETALSLDAAVPGFAVLDHYRATASGEFCSAMLDKSYQHGNKKSEERTDFDQSKRTAVRKTVAGGKSEFSTTACAKDALTYLQYLRHELAQGRLPAQQAVYFGAEYRVSLQFAGTQAIMVNDSKTDADRVNIKLKGPSADLTVEAYFAKDAARTPLLVRVPTQLAAFTIELAR